MIALIDCLIWYSSTALGCIPQVLVDGCSYTSLGKGGSVSESSTARAAIPLLKPVDEQPIYVNQMPSSDYEDI